MLKNITLLVALCFVVVSCGFLPVDTKAPEIEERRKGADPIDASTRIKSNPLIGKWKFYGYASGKRAPKTALATVYNFDHSELTVTNSFSGDVIAKFPYSIDLINPAGNQWA